MPYREGEIAGLYVRRRVAEIIRGGIERLAVLIDAQIAHIEVVARKLEIVGIAAEKRDRLLRREDEPHILIAAVFVKIVDAAIVELDRVAAQRNVCRPCIPPR